MVERTGARKQVLRVRTLHCAKNDNACKIVANVVRKTVENKKNDDMLSQPAPGWCTYCQHEVHRQSIARGHGRSQMY